VAQARAPHLGACSTYILRPHIFVGPTMQNYLVGALRGTPTGRGKLGTSWREKGRRLPLLLPYGKRSLETRFQFVHVDDMARLIAWLLRHQDLERSMSILNVAGRGEPIGIVPAAEIARQKIMRVPFRWMCTAILRLLWQAGISGIPPEALPYMIGTYLMDCSRLQKLLGKDYEQVMRYTVEAALRDTFASESAAAPATPELQHTASR
jgi:nucleoside-diphosphate-sugar epimerase